MNNSYKILEFNKITKKLAEYACTEGAKERLTALEPILSESELERSLRETTEARTILDAAGQPPLTSLSDMEKILTIADQGSFLLPEQLEYVERNLAAIKRLKDFLSRLKYMEIGLAYYEVDLICMEELREEILAKIRNGKVEDGATKRLRDLRREIEGLEVKRKEKAESLLRTYRACLSEGFITVKNDRLCLPVKKDCRSKISGSVVEKSSTGHTIFVEPTAIAGLDEELAVVRLDEENEERQILYTLTAMVTEQKELFLSNKRVVEKLDFIFAKGRLSAELNCVVPVITAEQRIEIINGRHPFLNQETCVPLNFKVGGDIRGIVITGPNTGGKTVSIKTVGLLSLMAGCGLHVPCERGTFAMHNQILCDIGDGQDITENLSTFSAHITNTLAILRKAGKDSLIIMDELGSGTDPAEGMGIAVAILEELKKCGGLFLVTTHYPEVKTYAEKTKGLLNARMAFDKESLKPLYRMEIGAAGESCAFYIAKHLGMPEEMLKTAAAASYGDLEAEVCRAEENRRFIEKQHAPRLIRKREKHSVMQDADRYNIGDSVMVSPEQKIGIVCRKMDEKGMVLIQLKNIKQLINHKRLKLHVKASELYPEDYDFSIIFDSVEVRKAHHDMGRKHQPGTEIEIKEYL